MLKEKSQLKFYGASLVLPLPKTLYTDSNFPFKLKPDKSDNNWFLREPVKVVVEIDTENQRLIITKADVEKEAEEMEEKAGEMLDKAIKLKREAMSSV